MLIFRFVEFIAGMPGIHTSVEKKNDQDGFFKPKTKQRTQPFFVKLCFINELHRQTQRSMAEKTP